MNSSPQVTVVVPTYNRAEVVVRSVRLLLSQDVARSDYEIVVVVDGSTDDTVERLQEYAACENVRVVQQKNMGLAAARNAGLRAARGSLIVFVDDDMFCTSGWLRAHMESQREHPGSVGMGAFFLSEDSPRSLSTLTFERELGAYHLAHRATPNIPLPVTSYVFGNTSAPTDLLRRFGGFAEDFRMREDAELAWRLTQAGIEIRYVANAIAFEFYNKTPQDLLSDAAAFALSDVLMIERHPGYLEHSVFGKAQDDSLLKRLVRQIFVRNPALGSMTFGLVWRMASRFPPRGVIGNIGVRALHKHRMLVWWRTVAHLRAHTSAGSSSCSSRA